MIMVAVAHIIQITDRYICISYASHITRNVASARADASQVDDEKLIKQNHARPDPDPLHAAFAQLRGKIP